MNRDKKLNKVLERMLLRSTKGMQKAFLKLRFHAKNQDITAQQTVLAAKINDQNNDIAMMTDRVSQLQQQLMDNDKKSAEYIRTLKAADEQILCLKETMHEQLLQKDLELESMDISVKLKSKQIAAMWKNKLTKTALMRMLSRAKIDTQRAFFLLKMHAQKRRLQQEAAEKL